MLNSSAAKTGRGNYRRLPKDTEGCRRIPKDTESYRRLPKAGL